MSMSVVARGLRYHASAIAPPNWCGTRSESNISWTATIFALRPSSPPATLTTDACSQVQAPALSGEPARDMRAARTDAGAVRRRPCRRSQGVRAAPHQARHASRPAVGCPNALAMRLEPARNRSCARRAPDVAICTRAPARRPEPITASRSNGRCALRAAAARTSSVRTAKPASVRERGPFAVCKDSRISNRPPRRATT